MPDGNEPITDDEFVFRRIPASMNWYNREVSEFSSPQAFTPITHDRDGLSLVRAKYMSAEECGATGMEGRQFYVAIFSVRVLREHNIIVEPDPQEGNPGHCLIPSMIYSNRDSDATIEQAARMSQIAIQIDGPFWGRRP